MKFGLSYVSKLVSLNLFISYKSYYFYGCFSKILFFLSYFSFGVSHKFSNDVFPIKILLVSGNLLMVWLILPKGTLFRVEFFLVLVSVLYWARLEEVFN